MAVLSSRFLVLASVASVCYAGEYTGMDDMTRGNCEIVRNHDWNTTGENLNTLPGVASAEACQETCANTAGCDTFTWGHADANTTGVALTCWLKKSPNMTVLPTTTDKLTPYAEVDSGACPIEGSAGDEGNATVAPAGSSGSSGSWPVWGWILLALGLLGLIGGLAAVMMMGKKEEKPKKKKRAVAPPAPAEALPAAPATSVLVAPPIYMAPPVYTAAPVSARAVALPTVSAPVTYAAPVASYAVPSTGSFVATAAPVAYATAPAGVVSFNELDTNHDGVITRAEFSSAGLS